MIMTGFLVNLLSPVFSSLGVSQADLTSYIEKLIGYVIAIFALLVVMIVVMVVAHKAKKGFRHVIRWQAAIAFIAIVAVLVNVICYGPMYNNVSSVLNAKKVVLAQETTDQSRATIQKVAEEGMVLIIESILLKISALSACELPARFICRSDCCRISLLSFSIPAFPTSRDLSARNRSGFVAKL